MSSVTEIQLNKLRVLFPARFAPMIWQFASRSIYIWGGGARGGYIVDANRAGKSARSLFNCISVKDDKIYITIEKLGSAVNAFKNSYSRAQNTL